VVPGGFRLRPDEGRVVFFDVETQRSAAEVGGWRNIRDMRLALAVVYDVRRNTSRTYFERDVDRLLLDLVMADCVIGYNSERFDLTVLSAYGDWDLGRIRSFDMLRDIRRRFGMRLKLGDLAEANLAEGKSADGLQSLAWFREGRLDLVEAYCRRDVEVTAQIFFLGRERRHLLFHHREGTLRLPVDW
jgi:DEAD/DEAH box helicase domain-containing protein